MPTRKISLVDDTPVEKITPSKAPKDAPIVENSNEEFIIETLKGEASLWNELQKLKTQLDAQQDLFNIEHDIEIKRIAELEKYFNGVKESVANFVKNQTIETGHKKHLQGLVTTQLRRRPSEEVDEEKFNVWAKTTGMVKLPDDPEKARKVIDLLIAQEEHDLLDVDRKRALKEGIEVDYKGDQLFPESGVVIDWYITEMSDKTFDKLMSMMSIYAEVDDAESNNSEG